MSGAGPRRVARDATATELCALCRRPLGRRREKHHLVPRAFGGTETVPVHPICHRKIHAALSERDLAARYDTVERLREHPDIARFVNWVARRPPDFHKTTRGVRRPR